MSRAARAVEWLLDVSASWQIFFLTSMEEVRDTVKARLKARGALVAEYLEADLEIIAASAPTA